MISIVELNKEQKTSIEFAVIAMVVAGTFIILYRDALFTNRALMTYPNGCQEEYINMELVSESCNYTESESLYKENQQLPWWIMNQSINQS